MCVYICMCSFIYLFESGNMTLYTSKYSQRKVLRVGKSFISLGSFHQEVEKVMHFHLSYFLSRPSPRPFFQYFCFLFYYYYSRIIYQSQVTGQLHD